MGQVKESTELGADPIYTAPSIAEAEARSAAFAERWDGRYPAMVAMLRRS